MEPVIFAIAGVAFGTSLLRGVQELVDYLGSRREETGSITNYDNRFENADYVEMIHKTIVQEKEEFGAAATTCSCKDCKYSGYTHSLLPVGPEPVKSVTSQPVTTILENGGRMVNDNGRITFHNSQWAPSDNKNKRVVYGYVHHVPDYVPDDAEVSGRYDDMSGVNHVIFTWFTTQGQKMAHRSPSTIRAGQEDYIHVAQYEKPIRILNQEKIMSATFTPNERREMAKSDYFATHGRPKRTNPGYG